MCTSSQAPSSSSSTLDAGQTHAAAMRMIAAVATWLIGPFVLIGCMTSADQLRTRSAFDLSCPKEQIMLTRLDGSGGEPTLGQIADGAKTVGAEGCGRKASYMKVEGDWIKNSETSPK